MSEKRWMSSGFLQAAPIGEVNRDKGVIEGVSVCTVGEAQGHGINLDSEFIASVTEMGNAKKQGLKARFGHPNMCSTALGTFLGRFKNFRIDGEQVRADLFVSNEAKDTPHGNLYSYVFGMAENEPDMFGTSIVFTPGRQYQRNEDGEKVYDEFGAGPIFVECETLHACDAVDEPAANDGLFSRFSQETIAGQITEFLDLHPLVWDAIESNPSILAALARHGDKVDEFTNRYREYREHNGGHAMTNENPNSEQLEDTGVTEPEVAPETTDEEIAAESVEIHEDVAAESVSEEPVEEAVEQDEPTKVGSELSDGIDALNQALNDSGAEVERLTGELEAAQAEIEALTGARDEALGKLAAIETGEAPVSAAPAEKDNNEKVSAWKKAQKK